MPLKFRGLELCGTRMWERPRIVEALTFAKRHDLNALVLHDTDLGPRLIFPKRYFDPYTEWDSTPVRRGENAIHNNRAYLTSILELAARQDIPVWLELKELTFPDEVLERFPHLLKDGRICPSEPVWFEFLGAKFTELAEDFPQLAGVIMSPGSPEGRASRAQHKCRCPLCEHTTLADWYEQIIASVYAPLAHAGLRLAVRDFAYRPADHRPLTEAVNRAPADVIFCMKVTPHDFYPTFPDNPAIGALRREQWVEYDVYGQFYGWGVFPVFMRDDLAQRLRHAQSRGVSGALFRTEWERVNDWWCLETPNRANLIAAARLAGGDDAPAASILRTWLEEAGWPADADTASFVAGVWDRTWAVIRKGIYLRDFVFHDSSQFPLSVRKAWWTMERKHSLVDWDPARANDLRMDASGIDAALAEKDEAMSEITALRREVEHSSGAIPAEFHAWLRECFGWYVQYIAGFRALTEVSLYVEGLRQGALTRASVDTALAASLRALDEYLTGLAPTLERHQYPHQFRMLLSLGRARTVLEDGLAVYRAP